MTRERDLHYNRKIPSQKISDICSHDGNAELYYYFTEVFGQRTQQIACGNKNEAYEAFVEIPDTQKYS